MKRLLVFAVAALLIASSAFAVDRKLVAEPDATFQFGVGGAAEGPSSTNNDDTCDISTAPAATLLLPYFEVEVDQPANLARTTLFTVTNVSHLPQIAHVTLWTDWSFPVIDFNLFLTGYDVQSINIYDILGGGGRPGFIGANQTSSTNITTTVPNNLGTATFADPARSATNTSEGQNPNFLPTANTDCASLPGNIPPQLVADARNLLTTGRGGALSGCVVGGAQVQVGGNHPGLAIGYVTIDVAATCSIALPTVDTYYTNEILFDNVLIGEYYDINPDPSTTGANAGNYAGGNPMVHIRAIPEGGRAGGDPAFVSGPTGTTNLPYTFYDRYTPATNRRLDRRQPLPSTFAARWISGGPTGFATEYKIWREGLTRGAAACADYTRNSAMPMAQIVRFDEAENAAVSVAELPVISPQPGAVSGVLPETSQEPITNTSIFPSLSTAQAGAVGGWTYLNLNNVGTAGTRAAAANVYSSARAGFTGPTTSNATAAEVRQSQNWVIVSMFAEGRYGVDYDAAWLGNGCSISPSTSTRIGPTGGVLVCPGGAATCAATPTGTNVTP